VKGALPAKAKGSALMGHLAKLLAPLSLDLARALAMAKTFANISKSIGEGSGLGLASVVGTKQRAIRKMTTTVRMLIIVVISKR